MKALSETLTWDNVKKIILVVSYTVVVYGFIMKLDTKVELMKQEQTLLHKEVNTQISELVEQQKESVKIISGLTVAVNKATMIMERLDRKLGNP